MHFQLLLWLTFVLKVGTVVFNKQISKPLELRKKNEIKKVNNSKDANPNEKYSKDLKQKRQFIPGNQFWPVSSYPGFQQAYFQLQQKQIQPPNIYQQQANTANNFFQQTNSPINYETVSNPSPTKITIKLEDIKEAKENAEAAYKGLTYYTGDLVDPKFLKKTTPNIAGYPVSLDVDKEKEKPTRPPKVTVKQKTGPSINGIDRDQLYISYATLRYGDQSASSKISMIPNQLMAKPPELPSQLLTKPPDIKLNKSALAYIGPKTTTTITTATKSSTTTTTTTKTTVTTKGTTTTTTNVPKKDCSLCKNKNCDGDEEFSHCKGKDNELPDGTMCYLPRIVVNTRLMGTTVINEIKIYTSPRDENSVHRFVTSHEVSDAATKISHEFILPPQFITQKELSAADLKYMNNTPVMITSAYAETSHQHMQIPINMLAQYPMNAIPKDVSPTYNPYLPTRNEDISNGKQVTVAGQDSTTKPTTCTLTTCTTAFIKSTTTTTPTTAIPKTKTTTTSPITTTTTTTTTTSTATTTTTTITITTTTTITTTSTTITTTTTTTTITPQIKKRSAISALNYAARHRNPLFDVPGGDTLAFSRYQILGPPNVHQMWNTHKNRKRKRKKK